MRVRTLITYLPALALVAATGVHAQSTSSLVGRWEGEVEVPGAPLALIVDLARDPDGGWVGSAILPGFGVKGAPLGGVALKDSELSCTIKGALGEPTLHGRLAPDGSLAGELVQAGNTARFVLHRSGEPQVDLPRQSTAVSTSLQGEWQGAVDLAGSTMHVGFRLANRGDRAVGEFVALDQAGATVPLDLVIQDGNVLLVELNRYGIRFEGEYRSGAGEIAGRFAMGPIEVPLVLRRQASR